MKIHPQICRTPAPLESLAIGHTIVLSRGLLDVLPNEAALAAMLAHELGHILLGHRVIDTKFSFHDRMMIEDAEVFQSFRFSRTAAEESEADAKAMELLKNSPYAEGLADVGVFLRAVAERAGQLPRLIRPHMGNGIAKGKGVLRLTELMNSAPNLEMERTDQIAALPLGSRIHVDPWSGRIGLMKYEGVKLLSPREKMPFEVTPFMPYLSYARPEGESESLASSSTPAPEVLR